jgi:alkylation response protein AidB-like acyl-CoA dehydrogenase
MVTGPTHPTSANVDTAMSGAVSSDVADLLQRLDAFIESEIAPLQEQDDNQRFFDHRREWARTDFENDGLPRPEWEELLAEVRRRADAAGFYRYSLPRELGGHSGTNVAMAAVREHLAHRGLGLHNDLQNEHSIVGNLVFAHLVHMFGSEAQREELVEGLITGTKGLTFGLTEPEHGSDATWLETTARREGGDWIINGAKRWNTGIHTATHALIFARTSGEPGSATGITALLVPTDSPGVEVPFYWWTFNMPTDHGELILRDVRVPAHAVFGPEGEALTIAQTFLHENRIRQAASSLGAAQYCIDRAVDYAKTRKTFGRPLSTRQAIQWPLVELHTEAEMCRALIYRTAADLDDCHSAGVPAVSVGHRVSMCNYRSNRLACDAADRAMQVHGGIGYSRHEPFEHLYRHHRRYRITEGAEEVQMRRVAGQLFGFL